MRVLKYLVGEGKNETIRYDQGLKPYHEKIAYTISELSSNPQELAQLLDVGCGVGNTLVSLMKLTRNIEFHVADIDKECLKICESKFPVASSILMDDIHSLTQKSQLKYDLVVYSHVLQYEPNPLEALNILMTLVKPGGHLIIAVSNSLTPIKISNCLLKKQYSSGIYTWDRPTLANLTGQLLESSSIDFNYDYVPLPLIYRYRFGQSIGKGLAKLFPWLAFSLILSIKKNSSHE